MRVQDAGAGPWRLTEHVWLVPSDGYLLWNWLRPDARRLKNVLWDVVHWQKRRGLVPDGLIGQASWGCRNGRLVRLGRRCLREMERSGYTHLQTYRTLRRLLGVSEDGSREKERAPSA